MERSLSFQRFLFKHITDQFRVEHTHSTAIPHTLHCDNTRYELTGGVVFWFLIPLFVCFLFTLHGKPNPNRCLFFFNGLIGLIISPPTGESVYCPAQTALGMLELFQKWRTETSSALILHWEQNLSTRETINRPRKTTGIAYKRIKHTPHALNLATYIQTHTQLTDTHTHTYTSHGHTDTTIKWKYHTNEKIQNGERTFVHQRGTVR